MLPHTTPWDRVLLGTLTVSEPVMKFPTFYGTHKFIKRPTHSQTERFYCVTSYLTEKLSKLRSLAGNSAGLRTVLSSHLPHKQSCAVHSGNPTVSSVYLPTPRWHHLKAHPFLAIHSADKHRMIYSFSNTTSYSTFYAFLSSFRITLWPMWLANSKQQPCFYPS